MRITRELIANRNPEKRGRPFLKRWHLVPKNTRLNVYLHCFVDDDDTTYGLHDHPWDFWSFILWRGYVEWLPDGVRKRRWPLSVAWRPAETRHAVKLIEGRPSWSIIVTGPIRRNWGFWTIDGWRSYREIRHWEEEKYGRRFGVSTHDPNVIGITEHGLWTSAPEAGDRQYLKTTRGWVERNPSAEVVWLAPTCEKCMRVMGRLWHDTDRWGECGSRCGFRAVPYRRAPA